MAVRITRAGPDRLDELRPLFVALHEHHPGVTTLPLTQPAERAWLERRATYAGHFAAGRALLHIADDEAPVGYAFTIVREATDDTFPLAPRYAELYTLSVAASTRDSGVGIRLLDAVDADIAELGVSALTVAVMADNEAAIRLHRRRGLEAGEVVLYRFAAADEG